MANENINTYGLVGHWKFNEESIQACPDSSGNANYGTLVGSPTWAAPAPRLTFGENAHSLALDGSTNGIIVTNSATISPTTTMTLSFWFYASIKPIGYASHPIAKWDGGTTNANYVVYHFGSTSGIDNQIILYANAGGTWKAIAGTYTVSINTWYLVTFTYDSVAGGKMFVNGVDVTSISGTGALATTTQVLGIGGAALGGSLYHTGFIDDFRIYNRVLSQAEITELYSGRQGAVDSALKCWLKMDGIRGIALDSSGNGNNGTYNNSPTVTTSVPSTGRNNPYALSFNGSNQYLNMSNPSSLSLSIFTVSSWFKYGIDNVSYQYQTMISKSTGSNYDDNYHINVSKTTHFVGAIVGNRNPNITYFAGNTQVNDGNWHMATLTYNSTTGVGILYVDGVAQDSKAGLSAANLNSNAIDVGRYTTYGYWSGSLDDIRIYNRALSASEVLALYQGKY